MWCGGRDERKKRENALSHDGIDGGGGTGVNSNRAATAAYRMIGPGVTNFMVLFDNQKFGNRTDTTRTNMGVQNVGLRTRGGVRCLLLIVNDEGMDYGGRPDIGRILERWGTDGRWGGGGEGQWFHTIAAAKFILRAKTLEIAYAQTRRYE